MQISGRQALAASSHPGWPERGLGLARAALRLLDRLAPGIDLVIRIWVATVFFRSGLATLGSWSSTVARFENVYALPLIAPEVAAALGTAVELAFSVLLVLGLGARLSALVLFVVHVVAVMSYPELGEVGLRDHQALGLLLVVTLLHGPGRLSLDHLIGRRFSGAPR